MRKSIRHYSSFLRYCFTRRIHTEHVFIGSLLIIIALSSCSGPSTSKVTERPPVLGRMSWIQWLAATGWQIPASRRRLPEDKINRLAALTERHNIRFTVFASTECGECEDYLPRLFGIFQAAQIGDDRIELYGLDGELREPGGAHLKYDIPATPSVFLSSGDKVLGRLVYPNFNWLDGMLDILGEL